ncbi:MAG: N-formylglutamate amidohydrolase [Chloroflexota bacterium]|nr:N-formylglutamate amidohydrolase [Chloroflexota bacterium]
MPFQILGPTSRAVPVVGHVPHASIAIPIGVRDEILLDDECLARELVRLTDWHTDELFDWLRDRGATMFVNQLSRLVFDPERFADDAQEPMAAVGQGAIYTRTTSGGLLRELTAGERAGRMAELFVPYHAALSELVGSILARFGRCTLIDCHSFATLPLPSESDQAMDRPDLCIGTDPFHTPAVLADDLERAFRAEGFDVRRDSPFSGCLVPLDRYRRDRRVASVMIEVRRGLYCDEKTGERSPAFAEVRAALARAVSTSGLFG